MEPTPLGEGFPGRDVATELAFELAKRSADFKRSLPAPIFDSLATLVRAMNCYYSNLIEGHNTHPVDIERALNDDYSADAEKRDLQLEAKAHIEVQRWIDEGGLRGRAGSVQTGMDVKRGPSALPRWGDQICKARQVEPPASWPGLRASGRRAASVSRSAAVTPNSLARRSTTSIPAA